MSSCSTLFVAMLLVIVSTQKFASNLRSDIHLGIAAAQEVELGYPPLHKDKTIGDDLAFLMDWEHSSESATTANYRGGGGERGRT